MHISYKRIGKQKAPDWAGAITREVMTALAHDKRMKSEPAKIVRNWDNRPKFVVSVDYGVTIPGAITAGYNVEGPEKAVNIWHWLDKGTKPHTIRPVNAPALIFSLGYKPKTSPGGKTLSFGGPGTSSGPMVGAQEVHHPGTKARDFEGYLRHKLSKRMQRVVNNAIRRGLIKAWLGKQYRPLPAKVVMYG